jgi:hypothetical protein
MVCSAALAQSESPAPAPTPAPTIEPPPAPAPAPAPVPPQPAPAPTIEPTPAPAATTAEGAPLKVTVGGYIEVYYQGHIQNPSNQITNFRGFDNRSRTFTIDNVALDFKGEKGPIATHVIFQVGATPSTYYLGEPNLQGTSSVNATNGELWKFLQAANLTAKLPHDFVFEGGLFPSPIGIEVFPIKDDVNWSRSNLFFGLPFYHTGAMLSHALGGGWTGKFHVYNGWNSVVDDNDTPSVALSAAYAGKKVPTAQVMYFGGIERPTGSPLGQPWRSLFDAYAQYNITDELAILGQVDGGFEVDDVGTDWWITGAAYVKYAFTPELYSAVRGDVFYEKTPDGGSSIFFGVPWVAEGTLTLAYQPVTNLSARLEYRHDQSDGDLYFGGDVLTDPMTMQFIPNRDMQDTLLIGFTSWF